MASCSFSRRKSPTSATAWRFTAKWGLPTEALTAAEMARRFPMIDFAGIQVGLFEPGFGGLMARRAVQTLVQRYREAGGLYQQAAVAPPSSGGDKLTALRTANGAVIEADLFVFACGPWLGKLFPDLLGPRIFATRQEVFFFAPPAGEPMFQPGSMPGWADFNGGDMYYGFPDLGGSRREIRARCARPENRSRHPEPQADRRGARRRHRLPRPPLPAAPRGAADRSSRLPV